MEAVAVRMSADERRAAVVEAAMIEFGLAGFEGTSTEAIAKRVGVSQPYLFRLFPSKKAIFVAALDACFQRILDAFTSEAAGRTGQDALHAMGVAYHGMLDNREVLQLQLQMWAAACHDEEIRRVTRSHMIGLWQAVQRLSGLDDDAVMRFTAAGMLMNVMAAMDLPRFKAYLGDILAPPDAGGREAADHR